MQGEYHRFSMEETETISEYYSRFTRLITKLSTAGVGVEETSKSMVIIDGLNSKFLLIKEILKNTPGLKSTLLTQIIGKLELEEGEQAKASSAKKVENGIALKISKALTRLELE